jgi:hypothetical protein
MKMEVLQIGLYIKEKQYKKTIMKKEKLVIAGMASLPERVECLKDAVNSIINQVDKLIVGLNNYKEIPEFLNHPKIEVHLSDNSRGDAMKFYKIEAYKGHFYIALDDDLIYRKDFVERMLLHPAPVTGVHGVIIKHPCNNYYRDRIVYHGNEPLAEDLEVDVVATCGCKIDLEVVDLSLSDFPTPNMCDIYLANAFKKQGIKPISLKRTQNGFYIYNPKMDGKYTIYQDLSNKPTPIHNMVIKNWNKN